MYYKLILENGHIGSGKSLETVRYFKAEDPVDVFGIALRVPRVKGKDRGTGVKLVQPVSREEYIAGTWRQSVDPYLNTRKDARKGRKGSKRRKEVIFQ